jgi:hypothetical protein
MRKKTKPKEREDTVMLSQSFMNDAIKNDICPAYLKNKYIDLIEEREEEDTKNAMFKGRYFEWHLLGATRDGIEPIFDKNTIGKKDLYGRKDFRPAAEIEMDLIVENASELLYSMGLDPDEGEKQKEVISEDFIGHLDWVTRDLKNPDRKAIYDVKYTETKIDDRFIGWADFESKHESRLQAIHYIIMMYLETGEYMPFYFLIFGKSGWVRVIKVEMTSEGLTWHENTVKRVKERVELWKKTGWIAVPEYNKCIRCGYMSICKQRAISPNIEVFRL